MTVRPAGSGESALGRFTLAAAQAGDGPVVNGRFPTRPVLIHGQFLRSDQLDAIRRLGIMPVPR